MKNSSYLSRPLRPLHKALRDILVRRRSPAARALFDTSLPFKPKTVPSAKVYTRKAKHKEPLS